MFVFPSLIPIDTSQGEKQIRKSTGTFSCRHFNFSSIFARKIFPHKFASFAAERLIDSFAVAVTLANYWKVNKSCARVQARKSLLGTKPLFTSRSFCTTKNQKNLRLFYFSPLDCQINFVLSIRTARHNWGKKTKPRNIFFSAAVFSCEVTERKKN